MESEKLFKVQRVADDVWNTYEKLKKDDAVAESAHLSVKKSTGVRPRAVIRFLDGFKKIVEDKTLCAHLDGLKADLEDMPKDGTVKLFTCHNVRNSSASKLEFFCVAVRKYKQEDEYVCDYFVTTYTYKKHMDLLKIACGGVAAGTGVALIFGAMAIGAAPTGVSVMVGAMALAAFGAVVAIGGGAVAAMGADKSISKKFNKILEANFMYELEQKGHARIDGREFFLDC